MNPTAEFVQALPIEQLAPSPYQPRRGGGNAEALTELASTIKAQGGILQPIVVRPITLDTAIRALEDERKQYQIVAGHRRVAAAEEIGLTHVPAIIRVLSDGEVKRWHLIENQQREALQALEEADAYAKLRDEGLTPEQIAEQVGKKPGVVRNRLKLLDLCDEARTALATGLIGAEVGVLIARIPARLQPKALARATDRQRWHRGDPPSYRETRDLLIEEFTLKLSEAIWDRGDAELLPNAGACTTCVKRSGGDPHLFSDMLSKQDHYTYSRRSGDQLCTDPDCFAEKKKAHLAREAARLKDKGKEVITGAAAAKVLKVERPSWTNDHKPKVEVKSTEYVPLDAVKDQLKKVAGDKKPAAIAVQEPKTGKVVQVVRRADLAEAGIKVKAATQADTKHERQQESWERQRQKREAAAKAETLRRGLILAAVRTALRTVPRTAFDLQLVAQVAYAGVDYGAYQVLADLWGQKSRDAMEKHFPRMSLEDLTLFVIDCALVNAVPVSAYHMEDRRYTAKAEPLMLAAKHYGVDVAKFTLPAEEDKPAGGAKKGSKTQSDAARAAAEAAPGPKGKGKGKSKGKGKKSAPADAGESDE